MALSFFVFVQLTALILIASVLVSSLYLQYRAYLPFKDYFEGNGLYGVFGFTENPVTDTDYLLSEINAKSALSVHNLSANFENNDENIVALSYDDEIITRFTPEMKSGRYLDINSGEIEAVVSQNSGYNAGDIATLSFYCANGEEVTLDVNIVGVIRDDMEIVLGGRDFKTPSYKNAFCSYKEYLANSDLRDDTSMFIFSYSAIKNAEPDIFQRLSEFIMIKYADDTSQEIINSDKRILEKYGIDKTLTLSEMDINSKLLLAEKTYQLMPIFAVMLILTVVSAIGSSALSARKRRRDYACYCLTGLTRGKCILVNLYQSALIALAAVAASVICFAIISKTALSEQFMIIYNSILVIAIAAVLLICIIASLIMPLVMIGTASVKQLLQNE